MNTDSSSKISKTSNGDGWTVKPKNCRHDKSNVRPNSLLCLFIEYVWDEPDEEYPGCKNIELVKWLKSEDLNVYDPIWYLSPKLDVRTATKIKLIDKLNSNKNLQKNVQQMNNERMYAKLACELRFVLTILLTCSDNVKFVNNEGQTLIHVFLEEHLKNIEHFGKDEILKLRRLIEKLVDLEVPWFANDNNGKTILHVATTCKSQVILKIIVESLIDIEASDQYGNTALHILVENCLDDKGTNHKEGYEEMIRYLILRGANVNARNNQGVTAVHLAAEKFHFGMLKFFVSNDADFSQRTEDNKIPLHFACKSTVKLESLSTILETIDLIISENWDVEAIDKQGYTALHYAAEFGTIEVVKSLIVFGAFVDCETLETLMTPLHLAALADRLTVMKILIDNGANVNAEAPDGATPIFLSTMSGSYESMLYLMTKGANIYHRSKVGGFTLLHMAAYNDKIDPSPDYLKTEENCYSIKMKMLIEMGFDVNDPGIKNTTPLIIAISRDNLNSVKILLNHGANVNNLSQRWGYNALHHAVARKNFKIVKILLENKAEVDSRGGYGLWTPLHIIFAVEVQWQIGKYFTNTIHCPDMFNMDELSMNENISEDDICDRLVTLLLDNGAQVNVLDAACNTPLHLAMLKPNINVIVKLLNSGAIVSIQNFEGKLPLHNVLEQNHADLLQLLFDSGADINDIDTSELIVNSKDNMKNICIEHAIKLKLVGLPINKVYEPLVQLPEFEDFNKQCLIEVKKMMNYREIRVSPYIFLGMNAKRQYQLIDSILDSYEDIKKLFPMYAGLIRGACMYSECRKFLLELARMAWDKICPIYLPDICVENILKHLNNRYLEVFDHVN